MSTVINAIITGIFAIIAAIAGSIATLLYQEHKNRTDLTRLTYGKEVAIQVLDGTYLQADANNYGTLVGGSDKIIAWSIFTIVEADLPHNKSAKAISDGDKVAFKVKLQGKWEYVSVRLQSTEQQQLNARSAKLGTWQTFTICTTPKSKPGAFHYGSPFALKACNDNIVTYNSHKDGGKKRLLAMYGHIKESETFFFFNPHARPNA